MTNETWDLVADKIVELRILTNANWKKQEYELAALGERILRTVQLSQSVSASLPGIYKPSSSSRPEAVLID
jgi:hypothetical protein